MEFIWDRNSTEHIRSHGVFQALVEKVFRSGVDNMRPSRTRHRYLIEAFVEGQNYRLICDISAAEIIYPVTCFHL